MRREYLLLIILLPIIFGGAYWAAVRPDDHKSLPVSAQTPADAPTHHATVMDQSVFDEYWNIDPVTSTIAEHVTAAVVPHHLVAGRYEANFFKKLSKQNPEIVVIVGPNHRNMGPDAIVTGVQNWRTPYGELSVNQFVTTNLIKNGVVVADDSILADEHSVGAIVPFIKKAWPKTTIVPFILKSTTTHGQLDALRNELFRLGLSSQNILVLASIDFSHYLPKEVANFHDELSANVLATGDLDRLGRLEIDSEPSLYFLLSYNRSIAAEDFHLVSHTNSATISGNPDLAETTSHLIGYFTAGPPTTKPLTSLQFFGDIMIDRNVAKVMGEKGLDYVFENLKGQEDRFFRGADLFVANLEGPFAPSRIQTSKEIAFRFDPRWAKQLKAYNFGAVSLANNHTYDMGSKNVAFTRELLSSAQVGYFGDQLLEGPRFTYYVTTTAEPVAFIGVENVTHEPERANLKAAIDEARARARYVIVFSHMGTEYKQISNTEQHELYHWLLDNGADAVMAAHPHVVEETEVYKGKPIIYSMGNFVFDQYFSKETQEGLSVGLTLQDGKVKSVYFFPMQSARSQVSLMRDTKKDEFMKWMMESSRLEGRVIDGEVLRL